MKVNVQTKRVEHKQTQIVSMLGLLMLALCVETDELMDRQPKTQPILDVRKNRQRNVSGESG